MLEILPQLLPTDPRLNDTILERTATDGPHPPCQVSRQALKEGGEVLPSVQDVEEELVDFGKDEDDTVGCVPEECEGLASSVLLKDKTHHPVPESNQVHHCDL